ncbi:hypothetical protein QWZ13_08520 [Reinekea marina]|nr:hypothetical protein [Reinekea marina]MDN3648953.1 hypothetical protein [Reinekea marina]
MDPHYLLIGTVLGLLMNITNGTILNRIEHYLLQWFLWESVFQY